MLKLLGGILGLLSCGAAGICMAEEKKQQLQSLKEIRQFFMLLSGEIRYGGTTLSEAIKAAAGKQKKDKDSLKEAFTEIAVKMEGKAAGSFFEIWREELLDKAKEVSLSGRNLEQLLRMGETLGGLDRETQLNSLNCYLEEIEREIIAEEKKIGEKVRLYRWLGALAGAFVWILLL